MTTSTLTAYLAAHAQTTGPHHRDLVAALAELARAGERMWTLIHRGGGDDVEGVETGANADGDIQTRLDVIADRLFLDAARRAPFGAYASEELDEVCSIDPARPLALAIDPLDGSSNVVLNLSFGTIFAILPMLPGGEPLATFMQPGQNQLAAGFIVYGPQLTIMLTLGSGTHQFVFDQRAGEFMLAGENLRIPQGAAEFAINASNYRHWDESIRLYFDDCVKGVHGPREKDFNMRWLASLVVEANRILIRGGVFLYPADRRKGYGEGRLRLVYEANPVAFLITQAGGDATNGVEAVLSLTPQGLHQRTPLIFGSGREVAKLTRYHTEPSAIEERAPLFGNRGLFRT